MEEYLDKKLLVYRKSFRWYDNIIIFIFITKLICCALNFFTYLYESLAGLSLSAGIVEIVDRSFNISECKEEYKLSSFM